MSQKILLTNLARLHNQLRRSFKIISERRNYFRAIQRSKKALKSLIDLQIVKNPATQRKD